MFIAQRNDHRAGQRGKIDDPCRVILFLRPVQRVAQYQPPFGIGVEHFDRLPAHGGDDIAGALRLAVGHIFNETHHADHIGLGLAGDDGQHRASHSACPAHVPLHVFHAGAGLQRDAAGVEGNALADEHGRLFVRCAAVPADRDQFRFAFRSAPHRNQRAHAERFHFGLAQHGDVRARPGKGFLAGGNKGFGVDNIGRFRHQIAGEFDALGQRGFAFPRGFGARGGIDDVHGFKAGALVGGQLGAILVMPPAAQPEAEQHRRRIVR